MDRLSKLEDWLDRHRGCVSEWADVDASRISFKLDDKAKEAAMKAKAEQQAAAIAAATAEAAALAGAARVDVGEGGAGADGAGGMASLTAEERAAQVERLVEETMQRCLSQEDLAQLGRRPWPEVLQSLLDMVRQQPPDEWESTVRCLV